MLFSTFFFSGTGNTKWAIEKFGHIVIQYGHQAEMYSIDNFDECSSKDFTRIVRESSFIGFANPIYGADVPSIMKKFISCLTAIMKAEKIQLKPIYIINTFGYVNASGPFEIKKLLDKDCFILMAYANIRLCNNISTYRHKSILISSDKLNARKKEAEKTIKTMVSRLLLSKKYIRGIGLYLLPGMIIRKKSEKALENNHRSLSIKIELCNKCMTCINKCPTHCIRFNGNQFEFSDKCTACMRCYNFCPTSSILIDGVYADPKEYFRYRGPERTSR